MAKTVESLNDLKKVPVAKPVQKTVTKKRAKSQRPNRSAARTQIEDDDGSDVEILDMPCRQLNKPSCSVQDEQEELIRVSAKWKDKIYTLQMRQFQKLNEIIKALVKDNVKTAESISLLYRQETVPLTASLYDISYMPGFTIRK